MAAPRRHFPPQHRKKRKNNTKKKLHFDFFRNLGIHFFFGVNHFCGQLSTSWIKSVVVFINYRSFIHEEEETRQLEECFVFITKLKTNVGQLNSIPVDIDLNSIDFSKCGNNVRHVVVKCWQLHSTVTEFRVHFNCIGKWSDISAHFWNKLKVSSAAQWNFHSMTQNRQFGIRFQSNLIRFQLHFQVSSQKLVKSLTFLQFSIQFHHISI